MEAHRFPNWRKSSRCTKQEISGQHVSLVSLEQRRRTNLPNLSGYVLLRITSMPSIITSIKMVRWRTRSNSQVYSTCTLWLRARKPENTERKWFPESWRTTTKYVHTLTIIAILKLICSLQHLFSTRIDPMFDGLDNSVCEVDVVPSDAPTGSEEVRRRH